MDLKNILKNWVLPPMVVVLAVGLTATMVMLKPEEARSEPDKKATLVTAVEPATGAFRAVVETTGVVQASQQITVMPQVSGAITSVSAELVPGGRFDKGDTLARIDSRDYKLALDAEAARVRQAELALELERGRQDIAAKEWELLDGEGEPDLALRRPHLASAEQDLLSAQGGYQRAELNLSRTGLRAPFDAVVLTESVDVGQVVGSGSQVATLAGTDSAWVRVSVPVVELSGLEIPGAPATLTSTTGERTGQVVRLEGQLDTKSRTATLIVELPDPLDGDVPLLFGTFVDVQLLGAETDATQVPRVAVAEDSVWVADSMDTLRRRDVEVGWTDGEHRYLTAGLEDGDRVVTQGLRFPVEGMELRVGSAK
ncbi:MAG: efflux RND transporter periplasmic adaptor subunit [Proteobacteria bacterium]|nr:efflux RND transporter periplasmic adaptor subunit [Pseudomonadota bacterium]MCP4919797.1 efflux RND transporter periplasmic adaptor subunit [Pseudomonadota bacterium]